MVHLGEISTNSLRDHPGETSFVPGLPVLEDPGVGLIDDLGQDEQVVSTEAVSGLPLLAILVDAGDRDVEPGAVLVLFSQMAALMEPIRTS